MNVLLVANRGEIASRIFRSARQLGIGTVAVFSDADANAPFVREADQAVRLPGTAPAETYLRTDRLIEAALRTGADAVHPGYGFLSEQADFARSCAASGLLFVGPSPTAIETMGSKITAKELMAEAGIPVLDGATIDGGIPAGDMHAIARTLGYPLLVKASAGGGGRGMRPVESSDTLVDAVTAAQREAAAAFGDGTVFLERLIEKPRHIEVQIAADAHGNVAHLFERECSIQRRHQKVIEEAPSSAMTPELREAMVHAAMRAARAVDYLNVGTVEFILAPDGTFAFLEMNTRLQVEHAVTEAVTGVDLVALQLRLARGEPLPDAVLAPDVHGHAIEARLYAEDVAAGYLPASGTLHRFHVPAAEDIRVDSGYEDGSVVSPFYDAMLAKVIAWAPTRAEAADRLADALSRAEVHGVTTNRDLLVRVLRHPSFRSGETDTGFLDRHHSMLTALPTEGPEARRVHALAATVMEGTTYGRSSPLPAGIPAGWRNVGPAEQPLELEGVGGVTTVSLLTGRGGLRATVDECMVDVIVHEITATTVDLEVDGHRVPCHVQRIQGNSDDAPRYYVDSALGSWSARQRPRLPVPAREQVTGTLFSPMPGTVVRVEAAVGRPVAAGAPIVTLEAMKMEHTVRSPYAGVVDEVRVTVGAQVDAGAVLAVLQEQLPVPD